MLVLGGSTDAGGIADIPATNLVMDLDARSGVTKASDLVSSWIDTVGSFDFAEATNKPLWVDSLINGIPGVRFDGSNDILKVASTGLVMPLHVFCVWNPVSYVGQGRVFYAGDTGTTGRSLYGDSATPSFKMVDNAAHSNSISVANGTWVLMHAIWDGSNPIYFVLNNGSDVAGVGDALATEPGNWSLGARYNGSTFANVEITRLFVYSAAQTGANLTSIYNHVSATYGVF